MTSLSPSPFPPASGVNTQLDPETPETSDPRPENRLKPLLTELAEVKSQLQRRIRKSDDPDLEHHLSQLDTLTDQLHQHSLSTQTQLHQTAQLRFKVEREGLLDLAGRMKKAPDFDTLLTTLTHHLRDRLLVSRVLVYRFTQPQQGSVITEAMERGWTPTQGESLPATSFGWDIAQDYQEQPVIALSDLAQSGLTPYQRQLLERFQVQAMVVIPICIGSEVWGLLVAQHCPSPRTWLDSELTYLYQSVLQLTLLLQRTEFQQQADQKIERERSITRLITGMLDRIRQSAEVGEVLKAITQDLRQLLQVDRVGVFRFNPDWSGRFVSESVGTGWVKLIGQDVNDTYFTETQGARYRNDEILVVPDLYKSGHAPCHIELIEQFQAKAYVVVPILLGDRLWGLLAVYQNTGPRQWLDTDVSLIRRMGSQLGTALQLSESLLDAQGQAQREQALTKIVDRIRQSLDPDPIFKSTTQEVRQLLNCERVALYRFNPDWSGEFIAESVTGGWVKLLGSQVRDTYFERNQGGRYIKGEYQVVNDVNSTGFDPCHLQLLEQFQAKAYVIVPVLQGEKLWGLLAAYQNSTTRRWEDSEVNLLFQIGSQFGLALQQAEYLDQLKQQSQQLAEAAAREKAAKELLQQRAIQLLSSVRPVFMGDLTVRAPITEDEVGTIADAYNNTIQSLRKLVTQVQSAARLVVDTIASSESSMTGLSEQTRQQLKELTEAQDQMQTAVSSTQAVVTNAQQVEEAVQQANQTLQSGDRAMNRTVDGILAIRNTVSETSKKIKRLSESSQKISKVVSLIGNFATQTNLLALNAAIEATRAGEYGRGFAVVADEVRSLARQSAAATAEIEKLVQDIQTETSDVTTAMETGIQQVVQGTDLVSETRQSLNAIVEATARISHLVEQITQTANVQNQQSQVVTHTMSEVAGIARQTSQNSDQIALSFTQLLAMAQELQASVGQFKVN